MGERHRYRYRSHVIDLELRPSGFWDLRVDGQPHSRWPTSLVAYDHATAIIEGRLRKLTVWQRRHGYYWRPDSVVAAEMRRNEIDATN